MASNKPPQKVSVNDMKEGERIDLGTISFSKEEIIRFAKQFDPLPFHVNPEEAKKSRFGDLIASGPQLFMVVHKERCLPLFGHTIIAGMEVNNWKMLQPVYVNQEIRAFITPVQIKKNQMKGHAVIKWKYKFLDSDGKLVQSLEVTALHNIS